MFGKGIIFKEIEKQGQRHNEVEAVSVDSSDYPIVYQPLKLSLDEFIELKQNTIKNAF